MSLDAYRFVWNTCKAKGAKKLMMLALADFSNADTGECFPSVPTLAKMLCISKRNASAALNALAKDKLIEIRHGEGTPTGTGNTNRYYLIGYKEWKKHHDKADDDYEKERMKSSSLGNKGMSKSSSLQDLRDDEIILKGMSKSSSKPVLEPKGKTLPPYKYPKRVCDYQLVDIAQYQSDHSEELDLLVKAWHGGVYAHITEMPKYDALNFVEAHMELSRLNIPTFEYLPRANHTKEIRKWAQRVTVKDILREMDSYKPARPAPIIKDTPPPPTDEERAALIAAVANVRPDWEAETA